MEDVLVIGGGGFIGARLVRLLRDKGHPVRVLSRSAGIGRKPEAGIRTIRGSVADRVATAHAVEGARVVFDLSLGARGSRAEMERDYIQGCRNVADACLSARVRRLIYASTTATLDFGLDKTIDETEGALAHPERIPGLYHLGKIAAETILRELHATQGLPAVVLRPGIVMGRGGTLTHSGLGTWRDSNRCLVRGKGNYPLPLVLADDVARAFFLAMDAPDIDGRAFNLVGDVRPTSAEMVQYIRQRSQRDVQLRTQSPFAAYAVDLAKWVTKRAIGRVEIRPVWHTYKASQLMTQFDCSAAKRLLGWRPVSDLETFLREAVDPHVRPVPDGDLRRERPLALSI